MDEPINREGNQPGRPVAKAMAAMEGAVEGLADGLDRHGLPAATHRAIDQLDRLAASTHLRRDTTRPSPVARKLHEATGRVTATAHQAQEFLHNTVDDTKRKAHAIAETGRRATRAPAEVSRDVGKALDAWSSGFFASLGYYAVLGVAGLFGLVLLTMAGIAALTPVMGAAGALLLFGVLYAVVGGICYGLARSAQERANAQAKLHMTEAREDLRKVGEPIRQAFGNEQGPYSAPIRQPIHRPLYEPPKAPMIRR